VFFVFRAWPSVSQGNYAKINIAKANFHRKSF